MRNHRFVQLVVNKMIEYNHQYYIDDIIELARSRQFDNNINNNLNQLANILNTHLAGNFNVNNALNPNVTLISSLKTYIYMILDNNDGIECCNKLICADR